MTKFAMIALALAFALPTQAATVKSADAKVSIARVVQSLELVSKPGLRVAFNVEDLGGSTDLSPTQAVYLTLYSKGEMFSTDATFLIAKVIELKSAKRVAGGHLRAGCGRL